MEFQSYPQSVGYIPSGLSCDIKPSFLPLVFLKHKLCTLKFDYALYLSHAYLVKYVLFAFVAKIYLVWLFGESLRSDLSLQLQLWLGMLLLRMLLSIGLHDGTAVQP